MSVPAAEDIVAGELVGHSAATSLRTGRPGQPSTVLPAGSRRLPVHAGLVSVAASLLSALVVRLLLSPGETLRGVLMSWDASWYEGVALRGYSWNPHSALQQNPAFFPLYPMLERAAHVATGIPADFVAIGSSIVFQAVAAVLLALIARQHGASDRAALLWVTLFAVSPVTLDIQGYYSALLCMLCFLALWLVDSGRPWPAAAALGLAGATNPLGIAFAVGFIVSRGTGLVSTRSVTRRSAAVLVGQALLSVSGIVGYMLYLFARFGDPLAFYRAQAAWTLPVPLPTELARILTFSPVRLSVTQWLASPYGTATTYLVDGLVALAIAGLVVALVATRGSARTFAFWLVLMAFLVVQVQSARWGTEIATTRLLLPVGFGVAAIDPIRRALTRPRVLLVLVPLLILATVFMLHRLATGQIPD